MGLEKGIEHGKEKRKPYYGAEAVDKSCRSHGSDPWSYENRMYKHMKKEEEMRRKEEEEEYDSRNYEE